MRTHPEGARTFQQALRAGTSVTLDHLSDDDRRDLLEVLRTSSSVGAICDLLVAIVKAWPHYQAGRMSKPQMVGFMVSESVCGAASSGGGAITSHWVESWADSKAAALMSGLGASAVIRHLYRQLDTGPEIPDHEEDYDADSLEDELNAILNDD